jgi:putative RNA 2'-phosphotransferase
MEHNLKNISKFMSLVLRHKPEEIGLVIDDNGWVNVEELIAKMNKKGLSVSFDLIDKIVQTNDKKRFAFSNDKTLIRASQGHSIDIDLDLTPVEPPETLYHGTAERFVESILKTGLHKQSRQHIHLSATVETAISVGGRHGKPVVLRIQSGKMHQEGFKFYLSENKVWLTDSVPAQYILQ